MIPVPKLSSPHKFIHPASIRFPKNFHPVGVSYTYFFMPTPTLSIDPEVGMDLANPKRGVLGKIFDQFAPIADNESEGVTKNLRPRIIFLSASPSPEKKFYIKFEKLQAHPN